MSRILNFLVQAFARPAPTSPNINTDPLWQGPGDPWELSTDPWEMVQMARRRVSKRKLRLLSCACARLIWPLLTDPRSRKGVEAFERAIDASHNKKCRKELAIARRESEAVVMEARKTDWLDNRRKWYAELAARWATTKDLLPVINFTAACLGNQAQPWRMKNQVEARATLAQTVRHIFGNLSRPCSMPSYWPLVVVDLAAALYSGEDCRLPLSDALEEAGLGELAEHFRQESWHPKGCWVLDAILAKK
jgi:hypothetical protein